MVRRYKTGSTPVNGSMTGSSGNSHDPQQHPLSSMGETGSSSNRDGAVFHCPRCGILRFVREGLDSRHILKECDEVIARDIHDL